VVDCTRIYTPWTVEDSDSTRLSYMDMITFVSCCSIVMQYAMMKLPWTLRLQLRVITIDMSIAKRVIQHCSIHTHTLTEALLNASRNGYVHIVEWLISDVMHLSYTDRIRWTFVTACVCARDVSDIQQLATRVHSDVTSVMSQALRVACYNGRHDVVKWLTSHTTADVSNAAVIKTDSW
jgi:hypothetical protein